jgi:hypothetical protein
MGYHVALIYENIYFCKKNKLNYVCDKCIIDCSSLKSSEHIFYTTVYSSLTSPFSYKRLATVHYIPRSICPYLLFSEIIVDLS